VGSFGRTDIKSSAFILQRAVFRKEREERGDEQGKGEVVEGLQGDYLEGEKRNRSGRGFGMG